MLTFIAVFYALVVLVSEIVVITAIPVIGNGVLASGDHNGNATYYFQDNAFGACGNKHSDSDFVIALGTVEYANGSNCGKTISITDKRNGKTAQGIVADLCPGCKGKNGIDLSVGLFTAFEAEAIGIFPVVWRFVD